MFTKISLPWNWNFETINLQLHYNYPMEIWGILKKNATSKIRGVLLQLHINLKMDPYIDECMQCIYDIG